MTHGADLTSKLSAPPGHDVEYSARCARTNSNARVIAATWFDGRAEACRLLGCGLDEVTVTAIPPVFLDLATGEITETDGAGRVWLHPTDVKAFGQLAPHERAAWHRAWTSKAVVRMPLRKNRKMKGAVAR